MKNDQEDYDVHIKLLLVLAIAAVIVCIVFFLAVYKFIGSWQYRGLFGDMFGALNALFSGLAFAGVIYAILLQRKELSLQREEMKLSREELAQQNQIISQQLKTMHESYKLQQDKERWDSEPVIKCEGGRSELGKTSLTLTNYGARITELEARFAVPQDNYGIAVLSG